MSNRAAALYALQVTDLEIDAVRHRLTAIRTALGETEAVRQARVAVTAAEAELNHWYIRQRDLELSVAGLGAKLAETEAQLYGGHVRNPKQLTELQAEAASLGRQRRALEDDLLEAMLNVEDRTAAVAAARQALADVEAAWQSSQAGLRAEATQLEARLQALSGEREAYLMGISADDLAVYEALRRRKGGQAVALVEGDACGACGVALFSSRLQQARQSESLTTCGNCDRILYLP